MGAFSLCPLSAPCSSVFSLGSLFFELWLPCLQWWHLSLQLMEETGCRGAGGGVLLVPPPSPQPTSPRQEVSWVNHRAHVFGCCLSGITFFCGLILNIWGAALTVSGRRANPALCYSVLATAAEEYLFLSFSFTCLFIFLTLCFTPPLPIIGTFKATRFPVNIFPHPLNFWHLVPLMFIFMVSNFCFGILFNLVSKRIWIILS